MADSIFPSYSSVNYLTGGASTHYSPIGMYGFTGVSPNTTERLQRMTIGEAGDFSELRYQLTANTYANPKSLNVQINAVASAITAAAPANTTGWFSDATHTASVVAGDEIALGITTPNSAVSNWTLQAACLKFTHASAVVLVWGSGLSSLGSKLNADTASVTRYTAVAGGATTSANTWSATESTEIIRIKSPGDFKYMYANVNLNSNTNDATLTFRVNAGDGTQVLTITAAATGTFSDTTHSDTVASGDDVAIKSVTGAGTVDCRCGLVGATFVGSSTLYDLRWARGGAALGFAAANRFAPVGGTISSTTESDVETQSSDDYSVANFIIDVASNSGGTGTDGAFRINNADGTLVISIAASATGIFEDTTHTDVVAIDDLIAYRITATASTTITIRQIGVTVNAAGVGGRKRRVFANY